MAMSTHVHVHIQTMRIPPGVDGDVRDLGVRKMVSVMDRAELEDKQLRLMEENLVCMRRGGGEVTFPPPPPPPSSFLLSFRPD